MLPLFKSHYSIGKSILTLDAPNTRSENSADSIFDILADNNINDLTLVEDSPTGFLQARKVCLENKVNLVFGLRLSLECFSNDDQSNHKVIIFAKNDSGCKLLNLIYSDFFCKMNGVGNYKSLKEFWNEDDLMLAIPFYDSFLYQNSFSFKNCIPDFSFCTPTFFVENNGLPVDFYLNNIVKSFCDDAGYELIKSKSIFYKNRDDLEAFQTYKCICNRSFGRKQSLSNPRLDDFGSREFCFESWKDNNNE